MNCDRARELISDSLDGVLAEGVKEKFEGHLAACAPCRAFHAEMKESLLLLEELPTVSVSEGFDDAVWSRLRDEESSVGILALAKAKLRAAWEGEVLGPAFWRWSPVAVAAAILLMFAVAPDPPTVDGAAAVASADTERTLSEVARAGVSSVSATEEEEEIEAEMPDAIERYLMSNARDLRITNDPDRFRHSNYSYPLRRVQDPVSSPVAGQVPVRRTTERSPETISF